MSEAKGDAELPPVQSVVHTQGSIKVNHGYVHRRGEGCVCIYVDLESKRAEYGGVIFSDNKAPLVMLYDNDETLHIDEAKKGEPTLLAFPEYKGWRAFSGHVARYTLAIVLVDE